MRVNDLISGAFLIALALAMIAYTFTFPPFPGQKYGPSLFPRILGGGLVLCGLLLMIRGRRQLAAGASLASIDDSYRAFRGWASVAMILGVIAAYILLSNAVGFVPVAFTGLLLLLWWFGVGLGRAVVIALIAVLAIDWFFGWLFRVPLPLGLLPNSPSAAFMNLIRGR
ncbi:MAG: tripartite tricarboxylate transporter TctB family protein [Beijerinckiaceae bacterium]